VLVLIAGSQHRPAATRWTAVALASFTLAAASAGCTSIERYSVSAAEKSCDSVSVCTVYGPSGTSLSPCISEGRQTVYPGDPRWPYTTPGVCDAVRDGKVVSTRSQ
jgi:hypothetical protein